MKLLFLRNPRVRIAIGLAIAAFFCLFLILEVFIIVGGLAPKEVPVVDTVLILGAGLNGRELTLTLKYRLDTALAYLKKHPDTRVVVSGGQGEGEYITEAAAMKKYLLQNGIDRARITKEDKSSNTYENFLFSRPLIAEDEQTLIVTNDFHMFRAKMLADHLGYGTAGLPAPSVDHLKLYYYSREGVAVFKSFFIDMLWH